MVGSFSPNFPALRPDVGLPPNRLPRGLPLSLHTAVGLLVLKNTVDLHSHSAGGVGRRLLPLPSRDHSSCSAHTQSAFKRVARHPAAFQPQSSPPQCSKKIAHSIHSPSQHHAPSSLPLRHLAGCPLLPPAHAHLQPRSPEELSSQSLQDSLSKLFIPR